ncbi:sigma-E processing peptidase SpoIIGA [Candidatus Soleaferrea massiliensis]|uniref:sigma-E processing peptidase SpoIIGA n=1 Tax=Candidatus Soleaferrea massiliensis TaxID=1470354 RepID=UPI00058EB77E|nr:sigma-E processing peptidase SpoIIGA [Candidatus Soleaferrea massiliensis]
MDVLFFINLFINYFLLLATMKIGSRHTSRGRLLAASLLGALYSVAIFFPEMPLPLTFLIRLALSATIVIAAFRFVNWRAYCKLLLCFFAVNFAFAGCTLGVWYLISPNNMLYQNGVLYVNISVPILIFTTIGAYAVLYFVNRHLKKDKVPHENYMVTVRLGHKEVLLKGFVDTGNKLTDAFSDTPVVVCPYEKIKTLLPRDFGEFYRDMESFSANLHKQDAFYCKLRMVPYAGVGSAGVLPAFRPDRFFVQNDKERRDIGDVLIAVSPDSFAGRDCDILLNPSLFGEQMQMVHTT